MLDSSHVPLRIQVVAEGGKAIPAARSEPSVELPLITASRDELMASPVKELKKVRPETSVRLR